MDLPNPGIELGSPAMQTVSLLTEESNQGLPHCKQILYQLSYQGNPPLRSYSLQTALHILAQLIFAGTLRDKHYRMPSLKSSKLRHREVTHPGPPSFPGGAMVKNMPASVGDERHVFPPRVGKIPQRRKWHPAPMDRGVWQATVHGVLKSWTRLRD